MHKIAVGHISRNKNEDNQLENGVSEESSFESGSDS